VRYYRDVGGKGPAWGRDKRATGPVKAWIFPDGIIEHCEFWAKKRVTETRFYDALGHRWSTVAYGEGHPISVTVHEPFPATVDVSAWTERTTSGFTAWLPPGRAGAPVAPPDPAPPTDPAVPAAPTASWHSEDARVDMTLLPGTADPFSAEFREGLHASCGCLIEGWNTSWIDGRPGARFRVRLVDPDQPWLGEVWAVSTGTTLLVLSAVERESAPGSSAPLALGRAAASLVRWPEEP
jgi:hypothetical protein